MSRQVLSWREPDPRVLRPSERPAAELPPPFPHLSRHDWSGWVTRTPWARPEEPPPDVQAPPLMGRPAAPEPSPEATAPAGSAGAVDTQRMRDLWGHRLTQEARLYRRLAGD